MQAAMRDLPVEYICSPSAAAGFCVLTFQLDTAEALAVAQCWIRRGDAVSIGSTLLTVK